MSFQPVVPLPGLAGWRFLERTLDTQAEAFARTPRMQRDTEYFREKIGEVRTAEDLVGDRRLLKVALGAFGLQDDLPNRYFVQRILEDGTLRPDSLANRLTDARYKAFSAAFGFGDFSTPRTVLSDFGDNIVARFERQEFELAIGTQNDSMRLALYAQRELETLSSSGESDDARWFRVMGTPPLRKVFETALGLPAGFGQLDIDRQLGELRDRSTAVLNSPEIGDFASPGNRDQLIRKFLVRARIDQVTTASADSIALTLLQNLARPAF